LLGNYVEEPPDRRRDEKQNVYIHGLPNSSRWNPFRELLGLINNAGYGSCTPFGSVAEEVWDQQLDINLHRASERPMI
jgi:NAD(P)-dependent dehydrogenase (short-subunit alcohol dehydrogenase family)